MGDANQAWSESVPPTLRFAVETIRLRYSRLVLILGQKSATCCHLSLTIGLEAQGYSGALNDLQKTFSLQNLSTGLGPTSTLGQRVNAHFDLFTDCLRAGADHTLASLLEVGQANRIDIVDPLAWGLEQYRMLIADQRPAVNRWLHSACRGHKEHASPNGWRAPLLLGFKPHNWHDEIWPDLFPSVEREPWAEVDWLATERAEQHFAQQYVMRMETGVESRLRGLAVDAATARRDIQVEPATSIPKNKKQDAKGRLADERLDADMASVRMQYPDLENSREVLAKLIEVNPAYRGRKVETLRRRTFRSSK